MAPRSSTFRKKWSTYFTAWRWINQELEEKKKKWLWLWNSTSEELEQEKQKEKDRNPIAEKDYKREDTQSSYNVEKKKKTRKIKV